MTGTARFRLLREHDLALAMAASLILHALISQVLAPFQLADEKLLPPIEVRLLTPPEPPPPEPKPPQPLPPPKLEPLPTTPVEPRPQQPPPPRPEPARTKPEIVQAAPIPTFPVVEEPAAPPVMTVPPQPELPPLHTVPPPSPEPPPAHPALPPPPPAPSPQQIHAARSNYGELLAQALAKHKHYPRLAQMRGWQGTTLVRVEIGADGSIVATSIDESSRYDILDRQALEMVKKANPLPPPPEALRNRAFSVIVPITFRLE